ncbi:hypothetical protein HK100_011458 [Physocladia obscura]|uniref:Uncharacterized protein n=1 Tax=Physocladia obscura TaxID=109957 RepID=A0AAD5TA68_9FUNG|nr:hypothetical protein HK100_011458 [Physocladia obscura]
MDVFTFTSIITETNANSVDGDVKRKLSDTEKPILEKLIQFRHSLQEFRKESRGAITLTDVNAKAAELSNIVASLHKARTDEEDISIRVLGGRNRIDEILDAIWLHIFHLWDKLVELHASLYPTYVSLVTLARTAEALRASGAWTSADVAPLQNRLRAVDETVAATEGKFVPNVARSDAAQSLRLGDNVPMGQAVLAALLNRCHRVVRFLADELEDVPEELVPLKTEVDGIYAQLAKFKPDGETLDALAPISKRLHAIDVSRHPSGKFGNYTSETGHAAIAGTLNASFAKLQLLVAAFDPVRPDSPLYETYRALLSIHSDLVRVTTSESLKSDPLQLSVALESVQRRLDTLEKQYRVAGTFVPPNATTTLETAIKLPGQAAMHKLLHDCHAIITSLVDPIALPVGETLVSTYELLMKQRTVLRRLRAYATAGWNVKQDLKKVEEILKGVESSRMNGLFAGPKQTSVKSIAESAELIAGIDADLVSLSEEDSEHGIPDGQAVVSALVDECDSLVWQIECMLECFSATVDTKWVEDRLVI